MIPLNQVKIGTKIVWQGQPFEVLEVSHLKVGRGNAKLVTKLRNLITQALINQTFQGEERLQAADISYKKAQFLYENGGNGYFMIKDNFEQLQAPIKEESRRFLREGDEVNLMIWEDKVIGLKLPAKVELKVSYTEPGFKGNTANIALKIAELETGAKIQVPLFIKTGDTVRIDTETGQYDSRV